MNITLEFQGIDAFGTRLRDASDRILRAAGAALYQEVEGVMTASKALVPVDLGVLRDSGFVTLPDRDQDGISVTMGYGGAASAYAVVQHEDLTLTHPNGGEAKFLEKPLLERAGGLAERIAAAVRAEVGG
jgi:hypothetical protein